MKNKFKYLTKRIFKIFFVFFSLMLVGAIGIIMKMNNSTSLQYTQNTYVSVSIENDESDEIINPKDINNGIHTPTGFINDKGLEQVVISCTPCHSSKLVTQNRANKEGWIAVIRWMQETQNLWDLGANEEIIVNYLAKNYAPNKKGRRDILKNIEWYNLN